MTPQVRTLITHFRTKDSISGIEAQAMYKMRALPRRIADLKELGYQFRREFRTDITGQRYVRYFAVFTPAPYSF